MPVTLSIQAIIDAQTTALNATINAARDNVKADNATQITNQNTSLTTAINAARDNVKADNVAQVTAQTTAINGNTDTKTAAVTTAVNAKGAIKSVQRVTAGSGAITIAAVDVAKSIVVLGNFCEIEGGTSTSYIRTTTATLTNATTLTLAGYNTGGAVTYQVVEFY